MRPGAARPAEAGSTRRRLAGTMACARAVAVAAAHALRGRGTALTVA
ncbi:hypothetical protein [uncultured Sphingomonas sp.]|nr:hypothetical protein [uncultured Sphingomonas sp.]